MLSNDPAIWGFESVFFHFKHSRHLDATHQIKHLNKRVFEKRNRVIKPNDKKSRSKLVLNN